jgi:hypothetical protein
MNYCYLIAVFCVLNSWCFASSRGNLIPLLEFSAAAGTMMLTSATLSTSRHTGQGTSLLQHGDCAKHVRLMTINVNLLKNEAQLNNM